MSYQPSVIEQRVEWTSGFRCATDKAVLKAMARWFAWRADGTHVRFTIAQLVARSGVPKRSVQRALERLEAGWWIEVTARLNRRPTTYRIVLERLATADPDRLQLADDARGRAPEWRSNEAFERQSGARPEEWRSNNGPDFDKVAHLRSEGEVRTERSAGTPASSEEVRHSGARSGARPEHPDVPAFLAWAIATYPQHASGAHLVVDRDRDGHVVHGLLAQYPLERLQAMTVQCWTLESDGDPTSHASWIAKSDRSLRVLRHKAAFLERVVVGAMQLSFGPLVTLSAQEIAEAKQILKARGRCLHDPPCANWKDCVREIARARHVS